MTTEAVSRPRTTTLVWAVVTAVCALVLPGAGYLVALLSLHPRFRAARPNLAVLLTVSTVVLVVQVVGLIGLPGLPGETGGVGPAERAG